MNQGLIIYLDGEYVKQSEAKISVFDQGVLFGDGVFEGIRVYSGAVFKCVEHINRLYDSAKMLMLEMPIITAAQRRNKASIIDPQIKSLNYLNNILAKIEAEQAGVPEALMLTEEGVVTECTGDNIFIVKEGVLITPPIHVGILAGITRNTVMTLAKEMGIEVMEKEFTLFNVYTADECFLTGTAAEVIPVREVDKRVIGNGETGPITKKLLKAFHEYAQNNGTSIY